MKKVVLFLLAITVVSSCLPKEDCMGIQFNNTNQQAVTWGSFSTLPSTRSYVIWIKPTAILGVYFDRRASGTAIEYFGSFAGNILAFTAVRSGVYGQWTTPEPSLGLTHIVVTYDDSSTSNDPIFYINGSSVTVTEVSTPSGTMSAVDDISLGDSGASTSNKSPTAIMYSFALYNRILSASEVSDAYNSRKAIPTYRGLVFAPDLRGAVGVDDGDTLGGTNYVRDLVSGATGTPAGSPVFYADNYLNWR